MEQGQVVFSPEVSFLLPFLDTSVPYLVTEEDEEARAEVGSEQAVGFQEDLRSCMYLLQSRVGEQEEQLKLMWEVLLKQAVMRSHDEKLRKLEDHVVLLQQVVTTHEKQQEFMATIQMAKEQNLATLDPTAPVFYSRQGGQELLEPPRFVPKTRAVLGSLPKISMDVAATEFVPKTSLVREENNNQEVDMNRGHVECVRPKLTHRVDSAAGSKLKHAG